MRPGPYTGPGPSIRDVPIAELTSANTVHLYRGAQGRRALVMLVAVAALGLAVLVDVAIGPSSIRLAEVWDVLTHRDQYAGTAMYAIVVDIRLPMTLTALTVGASLGLAGAGLYVPAAVRKG